MILVTCVSEVEDMQQKARREMESQFSVTGGLGLFAMASSGWKQTWILGTEIKKNAFFFSVRKQVVHK